ncbi:MAG: nuclear transport factor 2 family protein [Rhodospirillales bacterium]|nr:nuclear transport factor 2 family protein [Rhodospirillales bacterium]
MNPQLQSKLEELVDRQEIAELSYKYARAQDRLDGALQRSVFHDDAWTDYGYFKGDADGFVAFAQDVLRRNEVTQHLLGQMDIQINGATAYGEIYNHAFHRMTREGALVDLIVAGRYIDRYEKRDGVWKIAYRSEIVDWARYEPGSNEFFERVPTALRTSRDAVDPSDRRSDRKRPSSEAQ